MGKVALWKQLFIQAQEPASLPGDEQNRNAHLLQAIPSLLQP